MNHHNSEKENQQHPPKYYHSKIKKKRGREKEVPTITNEFQVVPKICGRSAFDTNVNSKMLIQNSTEDFIPAKPSSTTRSSDSSSKRTFLVISEMKKQSQLSPNNIMKNLGFLLTLFLSLIFTSCPIAQGQPPPPPAGFIDFDNLPVTRFSCEGKVIGGYYADVETGCQMFHVCTLGQKDEVQDIKFLCLNGTVFDQETRVCERVDEVDCSKAEQFYDLNLDLYVPHVATPKPPEQQDLEEDDDFIRPVSTPKPTTTTSTVRTTTSTRAPPPPPTTTRTTTTTHRTRVSLPSPSSSKSSSSQQQQQQSNSNNGKGFSSFNYYLKTPHSHVASGYNSQSQQSYIINRDPSNDEKDEDDEDGGASYTVQSKSDNSESTGRKIPSGPKTIVYNNAQSTPSTSRSRSNNPSSQSSTTTSRPPPKPEEYEEQYADEYYDDVDYDISSSTSPGSNKNYDQQPQSKYQPQQSSYGRSKVPQNSYDYRDGRSTSLSYSKSDRGGRGSKSSGSEPKSESVSVAISSSKSTRSPPVVIGVKATLRANPTKSTTTTTTTTVKTTSRPIPKTTPEPEPYYYDDDYPEDDVAEQQEREREQRQKQQHQPSIIVRMPVSSTTLRSSSLKNNPNNRLLNQNISPAQATGPSPTGPSEGSELPEYYDDGEGSPPVNVNDHHFTHVDVPRIPFAKPNVPRVLVTNGKPFLPRLTRHIPHNLNNSNQFSKELLLRQRVRQRAYASSFWDTYLDEDYNRKRRNALRF